MNAHHTSQENAVGDLLRLPIPTPDHSPAAPCARCGTTAHRCDQVRASAAGVHCCTGCTHLTHVPATRAPGEVEPAGPVIDGELMTPEDEAELAARKAMRVAVRQAGHAVRVVRIGATHPHTQAMGRFLLRHGTYLIRGMEAERLRKKAERGQADARAARAEALRAGDHGTVALLNQQITAHRGARIQALKDGADLVWTVSKRGALTTGAVTGGALVVGTVNSLGHWLGDWSAMDVLHILGATITTSADVIGFSATHWWLFGIGGAGVWLSRRWRDGRRLGEAVLPDHLRPRLAHPQQVELTESAMATALANIGIKKLTDLTKEGWPNRDADNAWVQFPMLEEGGKGWSLSLRLPQGASVATVREKLPMLAHNLGCRPIELFLEENDDDATVLDLFRLNPGVLREPAPPHPLLESGTADYFQGFPVGVSPRGEQVIGEVFERNWVVAGRMGSGKSCLGLSMLSGAVLDPLVDIDVFCFAENADYEVLTPCLRTLSMGAGPDKVDACMEHMRALYDDLAVRGQLLKKYGEPKVTREIATKDPGLRPRIVVVDECQALFRQDDPKDRKAVVNLFVQLFTAARKYAVTFVFLTPSPSDQSLPRELVSLASNRACGAISDVRRNNIVLGDKAHESGLSALSLKPAVKKKGKTQLNDVGTLVTVGFMDTDGAIRSHYVTPDQQARMVARAIELRGGPTEPVEPTAVRRDWLADLAGVLADDPMPAAQCCKLLLQEAPDWTPYRKLKRDDLVALLKDVGVQVPSTSNRYPVDPVAVRQALAARGSGYDGG
jgi:DNA segregation ATPase FtsK/SpoIIIE, S-DNA-T family